MEGVSDNQLLFVLENSLYFAWFQIFYSGDVISKWGMRWRWKWAWKVLIIGQSRHCLIGLTMKLTLVELRSSFAPMLQSISGRCKFLFLSLIIIFLYYYFLKMPLYADYNSFHHMISFGLKFMFHVFHVIPAFMSFKDIGEKH